MKSFSRTCVCYYINFFGMANIIKDLGYGMSSPRNWGWCEVFCLLWRLVGLNVSCVIMGKSFTEFAQNVSINTKNMVGNLQLCNHAESCFFLKGGGGGGRGVYLNITPPPPPQKKSMANVFPLHLMILLQNVYITIIYAEGKWSFLFFKMGWLLYCLNWPAPGT